MAISSVRLQNFRSYKDDSFEFEPGVNIIVGPNASGKTNILESLLVLARGSSYKAKDQELIRHTAPWARLDGFFESGPRTVKLENEGDKVNKNFVIEDKPYKRLRLEQTWPVVFFEPNHLQFINRGPQQRRDFIDDLLNRSIPGFKTLTRRYGRALAQRNALLKRSPTYAKQQLFAWNVRLSELGSKIAEARSELIVKINKDISKTYSSISHQKSDIEAVYDSQFPADHYGSKLLSKLESTMRVDLERGFTSHGPHREDISFYLNKQPISETASRGETRSLVLSLKIFELGLIEAAHERKPVFLLDDVFSELDGARRHALVDFLNDQQTIITTTDADAVIDYFNDTNIISVSR